MEKNDIIYVAGHTGLVGSAIVRKLRKKGYKNILIKTHEELDLTRQDEVERFFKAEKIDYVFQAAAKVGGIQANATETADFIYQNLAIGMNIVHCACKSKVKKLLFLGSSCIYPKMAEQPIKEDALLTGALEKTNEAYAVAKIAGLKMCEFYNQQYGTDFITAMPCNLYGPGDNYDLKSSHVIPALIRKFHNAKVDEAEEVILWGTGNPLREFLFVEDAADACIFLMEKNWSGNHINIGNMDEISIRDLAAQIADMVGYKGKIIFNKSMPDGAPRKILDSSQLAALGWNPKVQLAEGLKKTYENYLLN